MKTAMPRTEVLAKRLMAYGDMSKQEFDVRKTRRARRCAISYLRAANAMVPGLSFKLLKLTNYASAKAWTRARRRSERNNPGLTKATEAA